MSVDYKVAWNIYFVYGFIYRHKLACRVLTFISLMQEHKSQEKSQDSLDLDSYKHTVVHLNTQFANYDVKPLYSWTLELA